MLKEIIICVIIVINIIGLEIFIQNFTEKTVMEITEIFVKLEENILKQDIEKINSEVKNISSKWEQRQRQLAYYVEHDELE